MSLLDSFATRRETRAAAETEDRIVWAWRVAAEGAGLCRIVQVPTGQTVQTPPIVSGRLSPLVSFVVALLPGMLVRDVRALAYRLAPAMGAVALRIEPVGLQYAKITLLPADPLDGSVPLDLRWPGLLIGRDEGGQDVTVEHPRDLPHLIIQGQTRSGKSIWLYSLLAQSVREPDLEVAGVDPSGITLRPFRGSRWVCNGLADPGRIVDVLTELVGEMDRRLAAMPEDRDILATDRDTPVVLVVLDEYPALLRALEALKTRDRDPAKVVRTLVARMLAEAHKVGYRVVIAAQRAEASIIGAAERAQCAGRLSFRVDSSDSIKLLHPDGDHYAAAHTSAPPGIALVSWPGRELARVRGPFIGGYGEYVRAVQSAA